MMELNLKDVAEKLGWQVWGYAVKSLNGDPQTVYVLKSPLRIPFVSGFPVQSRPLTTEEAERNNSESAVFIQATDVPKRLSENDAWADLPRDLITLYKYSSR